MSFHKKFKGDGATLPSRPTFKAVLLAGLGGFCAIAAIATLSNLLSVALVMGSFGASCVLAFGFPDAPFSQPRNIVVGHVVSSLIGVIFLIVCGPHWWALALAVAVALMFMMSTRTVHPPAGSNPVIVFLAHAGWKFVVFPTLAGALIVLAIALIYNNATRASRYPKYW